MTARAWFASFALALIAAGVAAAAPAPAAKNDSVSERPAPVAPSLLPHRVIAYYFHTTYRCASCRSLEAYSREAIESAFAYELEDGRLVWKVVDVEVKGNEHFVEEYGLYTKSLVLVNEIRGKRSQWKNLEKVWQLLQDKEAFMRYVQDETRPYLAART
ncbi:MAG TPA: nitrophenyl compound nitroreductase subunit ArsF family protein [Candidatus Eisenbacteria bacterium]|nr:nitrophenyl compound nitroreductase subunit ArsF family protein [Candidatus Eisenbacteria bacterium]